jgi:hypothetical protein
VCHSHRWTVLRVVLWRQVMQPRSQRHSDFLRLRFQSPRGVIHYRFFSHSNSLTSRPLECMTTPAPSPQSSPLRRSASARSPAAQPGGIGSPSHGLANPPNSRYGKSPKEPKQKGDWTRGMLGPRSNRVMPPEPAKALGACEGRAQHASMIPKQHLLRAISRAPAPPHAKCHSLTF